MPLAFDTLPHRRISRRNEPHHRRNRRSRDGARRGLARLGKNGHVTSSRILVFDGRVRRGSPARVS